MMSLLEINVSYHWVHYTSTQQSTNDFMLCPKNMKYKLET